MLTEVERTPRRGRRARRARRARLPDRDRRLRHRVLVAARARPLSRRHAQDRPGAGRRAAREPDRRRARRARHLARSAARRDGRAPKASRPTPSCRLCGGPAAPPPPATSSPPRARRRAHRRSSTRTCLRPPARADTLVVVGTVRYSIGDATLVRVPYADVLVDAEVVGLTPDAGRARSDWAAPTWAEGGQVRVGAAVWIIESDGRRIVVDPAQAADDILRDGPDAAFHQEAVAAALAAAGLPARVDRHRDRDPHRRHRHDRVAHRRRLGAVLPQRRASSCPAGSATRSSTRTAVPAVGRGRVPSRSTSRAR